MCTDKISLYINMIRFQQIYSLIYDWLIYILSECVLLLDVKWMQYVAEYGADVCVITLVVI